MGMAVVSRKARGVRGPIVALRSRLPTPLAGCRRVGRVGRASDPRTQYVLEANHLPTPTADELDATFTVIDTRSRGCGPATDPTSVLLGT
jgi:hypothetical protein